MAKKHKSKGKGNPPQYSVVFSSKKGKSTFIKGPSLGAWKSDSKKVMANGAVKGKYLEDLFSFLKHEIKKDHEIFIAIFENDDTGASKGSSSEESSSEESSSEESSSE